MTPQARSSRQHGKYGRLPNDPTRPRIRLSRSLTGVVPDYPIVADYLARLGAWQMLGNDTYGDCITPETRVLTADLRWVPAGELDLGQKLLAFDEHGRQGNRSDGKSIGRHYRESAVECIDRVVRPCYELEFSDGTVVRCSEGHQWLIGSLSNGAKWAQTRDLKAGSHNATTVAKPFRTWDTSDTWEAGYLAAAWNGEGNLDLSGASMRLVFSQADNAMLVETEHCLKTLGIEYSHSVDRRSARAYGGPRQDIHRLTVGKREEFLRALGMVRPARLLPLLHGDLGRMDRTHTVRLVRKTHIGDREVVMLNTSSRTYFAEGLTSHNCVAVTWANLRRLTTAWLSTENYPTLSQVMAVYATQNPNGADDGMDIQTLLEYLVSTGGPDGVKAVGFAAVDYTNPAEVKAAIALFGAVWVGIDVLAANEQEFDARQPWDYVSGSPDVGGHSVLVGGYGNPGAPITPQLGGDEKFITWAQETSFTDTFWSKQVGECWVVIWPEHLGSVEFLAGVDLEQLATDYTEITGKPFPAPVTPVPGPPSPVPAPVQPPGCLAALLSRRRGRR